MGTRQDRIPIADRERSGDRNMSRLYRYHRAARLGYSVTDECFYTAAGVGRVLPAVLTGDYEQPSLGSETGVSRSGDPGESGDWMATRADVAAAWATVAMAITQEERDAVWRTFGDGDMSCMALAYDVAGPVAAELHG